MFSSHFEAVNHYKATHCWRTYQCHLCGTYFNNQNTMVSVVAHELCCEWTLLRLHNVQCTFVREFHSSFFLDQVLIHSSTDPSYHFSSSSSSFDDSFSSSLTLTYSCFKSASSLPVPPSSFIPIMLPP